MFCRHLKPLENQFSTWNHDIKEAILIFHRHGRLTVYITLFPLKTLQNKIIPVLKDATILRFFRQGLIRKIVVYKTKSKSKTNPRLKVPMNLNPILPRIVPIGTQKKRLVSDWSMEDLEASD